MIRSLDYGRACDRYFARRREHMRKAAAREQLPSSLWLMPSPHVTLVGTLYGWAAAHAAGGAVL